MADLYQHHEGGLYRILHHATDEATKQPVIVYQALQDDSIWVRTKDDFFETVHGEELGKAVRVRRFSFLGEE